jgi:hypothetical protein
MNIITINDPIVSYKVNTKGEHEFTVSLVNLVDRYIEHDIDENGILHFMLLNKETNHMVKVTLIDSKSIERVYCNTSDLKRIIKLIVV